MARQIDHQGYVRFKHWRLYGERGLAGEDVSVWVYEGNLKVEYQATALSLYELSIEKKTGEIVEVKNPRRLETHFRSPQLDLWQVSDTEWLLALRRPAPMSHVRESKERHGFRSSKTSLFVPILIISPPVYSHTAFLDDFFGRSFPYTQAETTSLWRTCGESSPLSKATSCVCAQKARASSGVCQTLVVCERSHRQMKGEEMLWKWGL